MNFNPKLYWDERLTNNFDFVGVGDISMGHAYNKLSYSVTDKVLSRIIKRYCRNKAGNVLDVGSGTGFIVSVWNKNGFENISGIDISPFAVEKLSQLYYKHSFYECDISEEVNALKDKKFNYVSCASVLYHIVDDEKWKQALYNIRSLMQKDGTFIFSEGFSIDDLPVSHQTSRTREVYRNVLQQAGFKVQEIRPNYILMSDPVCNNKGFFKFWWKFSSKLSRTFPKLSYVWWSLVYPVELLLTRYMKKTPSQEFWICKAV